MSDLPKQFKFREILTSAPRSEEEIQEEEQQRQSRLQEVPKFTFGEDGRRVRNPDGPPPQTPELAPLCKWFTGVTGSPSTIKLIWQASAERALNVNSGMNMNLFPHHRNPRNRTSKIQKTWKVPRSQTSTKNWKGEWMGIRAGWTLKHDKWEQCTEIWILWKI